MPGSGVILCATPNYVPAATPIPLLDPMIGLPAILPASAIVKSVVVYRDGDNDVTNGCTFQLGVDGAISKYIAVGDAFNTTDLNTYRMLYKSPLIDKGLAAETEIRFSTNNAITGGSLLFEITYAMYA
jgi:hypothetical protein